jgi:hypothetical protein
MKLFIFLIALTIFTDACAKNDSLPLTKGMSLYKARKIILHNGWKPHPVYIGEHIGVEHELLKNGFKEIEACTEGKSFCTFNYKKHEQCLRLITVGEEIKDMYVESWDSECEQGIDETK